MGVIVIVLALVGVLACFAACLPVVDTRVGHGGAGLIGIAFLLTQLGSL